LKLLTAHRTPMINRTACPSFHYAAALCSHAAAIHLPAAITRIGAVQRLANANRLLEQFEIAAEFSDFQHRHSGINRTLL
jgi:hypothetical protein